MRFRMLANEAKRLVLRQERIMTSSRANASPLRQRMIDDSRMRQLSPKTQDTYLRTVRESICTSGRRLRLRILASAHHRVPFRLMFGVNLFLCCLNIRGI
jgi:hypothetical protein